MESPIHDDDSFMLMKLTQATHSSFPPEPREQGRQREGVWESGMQLQGVRRGVQVGPRGGGGGGGGGQLPVQNNHCMVA